VSRTSAALGTLASCARVASSSFAGRASAAVGTRSTATVAATRARRTAPAALALLRHINGDSTAVQLGAVHLFDSSLRIRLLVEGNEAETAGPAGLRIRDHRGVLHFAKTFERRAKCKLIGSPGEAPDEQSLCHWFCLLLWGRRDADIRLGSPKVPARQLNT